LRFRIDRTILSDRYLLIITIASVILIIYILITYISINNIEKQNRRLIVQLNEMQMLQKDLIKIKDIVESKEKKIGLSRASSVISTLEQMLNDLGLKAKVIKPLEKRRLKEFTEENAELIIEGIDLNAIVNLLYKIENSPIPMKIKSTNIRTRFEDPDMFDLNLMVALITK
jgi:hypothetical protein